ncbi:MAG: DUF456 domain-containing protein [Phycisphaerales bacterium]|nr:DUF456 domain-containing protein [Phycisphaerales bacterium]
MGLAQLTAATVFSVLGLVCITLNLVLLPGNWLLLLLAILFELMDNAWRPVDATWSFHIWALLAATLLAILGEVIELASGAAGARFAGSSARGMWGALLGGVIGAVLGTIFLLPAIGTLLGAIAGCALGAIIAEMSHSGRDFASTLRPAMGAVLGRIAGVLGKTAAGLAAWLALTISAFLR